ERDLGQNRGLDVFGQDGSHVGLNVAWGDGVDRDVAAAKLLRQRFGESDQAGFRRGIIRLTGGARLADDARDVHDAAPAVTHHAGQNLLDTTKCAIQINVEHEVPVGGFHTHGQAVAGDAGVVHQDVDAGLVAQRLREGFLDALRIGDVEVDRHRLTGTGTDL